MALQDYETALVTGASSGIGAAVVRALCAAGKKVHAVARRQDRLDALAAETGCIPHVLDLRDQAALYDTLGALDVDILINNAGLGRGFEDFTTTPAADIDVTIQVNVLAALHVVRACVGGMKERQRGHIFNIGSVAGLYPVNSAVYGASKGAVHLMSQNLRVELAGTGIRVTEICPGRIETEFFETAFDDDEAKAKFTKGFNIMQPEDISDAIMYAADAPWRVNVGLIEMTPTEQYLGGGNITPVPGR
ncbi:MAG: SDR family oxidoreductase [Alphaproteobacteria bacterium]|jgi:NADP-dependent 3-hydroxy acid dehydrogenase YdfG|nr:SDR family oxidoreductase [Alphaproteobacteria bacterium]MBT4019434.1 SDR family oxidoreductase [Alphaproteobacteria bacterium]MBT4965966.1 SDR family oxidoreductase [Alphaproteobacteria bacterium]MBT5160981.1 SDR family oxidoreductase [Alphaproteobacteria bacterium]MBT5917827.1 SDR family oxidoreductase [Alphaproteobacteria bacterium]